MTPTDNDRAREARWNPPDPNDTRARLNEVERLTRERDHYRAALEKIAAGDGPGNYFQCIARNALPD